MFSGGEKYAEMLHAAQTQHGVRLSACAAQPLLPHTGAKSQYSRARKNTPEYPHPARTEGTMVMLVPVTDANYVQRRLRWDKPASGSEQRERERAEMDDAQREP